MGRRPPYSDRTSRLQLDETLTKRSYMGAYVDPPEECRWCLSPLPPKNTQPCQTIDFPSEVLVDEYAVVIPFIGPQIPNGVTNPDLSQCYYGDLDNRTIYPDYGLAIDGGLYVAINAGGDAPSGLPAYDYFFVFAVSPNDVDNRAYYPLDFVDADEMAASIFVGSVLTVSKHPASTLSGAPASVTLRLL